MSLNTIPTTPSIPGSLATFNVVATANVPAASLTPSNPVQTTLPLASPPTAAIPILLPLAQPPTYPQNVLETLHNYHLVLRTKLRLFFDAQDTHILLRKHARKEPDYPNLPKESIECALLNCGDFVTHVMTPGFFKQHIARLKTEARALDPSIQIFVHRQYFMYVRFSTPRPEFDPGLDKIRAQMTALKTLHFKAGALKLQFASAWATWNWPTLQLNDEQAAHNMRKYFEERHIEQEQNASVKVFEQEIEGVELTRKRAATLRAMELQQGATMELMAAYRASQWRRAGNLLQLVDEHMLNDNGWVSEMDIIKGTAGEMDGLTGGTRF